MSPGGIKLGIGGGVKTGIGLLCLRLINSAYERGGRSVLSAEPCGGGSF